MRIKRLGTLIGCYFQVPALGNVAAHNGCFFNAPRNKLSKKVLNKYAAYKVLVVDYLLFSESEASSAEPYPGDDGRLLVHTTMPLGELSSQTCAPMLRELARALENEADSMEKEEPGCDTWDDSQQ